MGNHTQRIQLITGKIQKELLRTYPEMELMSNADIKRSNLSLEELDTGIEAIAARFELDGLTYSADMLLDQYKLITSPKTKRTEPNNLVFDFIDKYITVHEPSREKGSMGVYKSLKRHLEVYQKHTRTKVRFSEIDYAFFNRSKIF